MAERENYGNIFRKTMALIIDVAAKAKLKLRKKNNHEVEVNSIRFRQISKILNEIEFLCQSMGK